MGANSAHKHSLPPVNEREVTPLLSPRTHDVSRELVLEEPRANRASARQRDMLTDKGQEDKSTDRLTEGHTPDDVSEKGPATAQCNDVIRASITLPDVKLNILHRLKCN